MNAKPLHVLAVDDEPAALTIIQRLFRKESKSGDIKIDCANTAQQALEILNSQRGTDIVLILSDVNMPGMSGIELLAAIRQKNPSPPPFVFVISAYNERAEEAKRFGADSFFPKPLDMDALKTRVLELREILNQ